MLFIASQARKKFPTLPANEISFAFNFSTQIPGVEILHLDEVIHSVPHFNDTIRSAASASQPTRSLQIIPILVPTASTLRL